MKNKSLYAEIDEYLDQYLKDIDAGDKHFNEGALGSNRGAAHYAIANALGHIRAIKEDRDFKSIARKKKKLKSKKL